MQNVFSRNCSTLFIVSILSLSLVFLSSTSYAQWHSQSDKLPGTISTGTLVLIGVGVAAAVVVVVLLTKKHSEKDTVGVDSTSHSMLLDSNGAFENAPRVSFERSLSEPGATIPVTIYYDVGQQAVYARVSLSF